MRRFLSLLIIVTLVLSVGSVTVVAEPDNQNSSLNGERKAELLNKVDILRGDGIDYNLEGQLKRAEAAAFIVRLVGMDEEVVSNRGKYLQIDFQDVQSHEWFAPYVGYCTSVGIVSGFEDGTFRPNDYVSEQAFLKMLLTAIGYTYNEDFVWSTVFESAYNLNLVEDESYVSKTTDNYAYTRGNVVEALFNTLKVKKKTSEQPMIHYFIENEIITSSEAAEYELIVYNIDTELDSVEVLSNTSIALTFNESIVKPELEDIIVYNKDDNNNQLTVHSLETGGSDDNYTIIFKSETLPDRNYGIIISNVVDAYGNQVDSIVGEFIGQRGTEIVSNYFIINKVEQVSSNAVNLHFTHPVNDNVLDASYYELEIDGEVVVDGSDGEIRASLIGNDSKVVVLTFDDYSFDKEVSHRLKVSGSAISQYGVTLNFDKGDFIDFTPQVSGEEDFELLLITAESDKTVELWFSKDLNPVIAEQIFSYYVTEEDGDPIAIESAEVTSKGYVVQLTIKGSFSDNKTYNIMLNNVNDISRTYSITEESHSFVVDIKDVPDIEINHAYSIDAGVIAVELNRELDKESAVKTTNYSIVGITETYSAAPVKVYYEPLDDPLLVKLYLSDKKEMDKGETYQVRLMTGLKDVQGFKPSSIVKEDFVSTSSTIGDTYIDEAVVVGENTVKLSFNKEIALDIPNVLNTNYTLNYTLNNTDYTKTPVSANYIDARTMIVRFNDLDNTIDYEITFDKLIDYSGIETDNSSNKYSEDIDW